MQDYVDRLQCVIIFLSGHGTCPVQSLKPTTIFCDAPLLIGIGNDCFFSTETLPKNTVNESTKVQCNCGKTGSKLRCNNKLCPCYKSKLSCKVDPECHCTDCGNKYGPRLTVETKGDPCLCRKGGCKNARCPCYKSGVKCSDDPR